MVDNLVTGPVLKVDSFCPAHTGPIFCEGSAIEGVRTTNSKLDTMKEHVEDVKDVLKIPGEVVDRLKSLLENGFVALIREIMSKVGAIGDTLASVLSAKICFPIPDAEMDCRERHFPCPYNPFKECSQRMCTPKIGIKDYCLTVEDI